MRRCRSKVRALARQIRVLDREITALGTALTAGCAALGHAPSHLPVGRAVALAALVAEAGDPTRSRSAKECVAQVGWCPADPQSGAYPAAHPPRSKAGNRHARRTLWRLASVAVRHHATDRAYFDHRTRAGKQKMATGVAIGRKLLTTILASLRTGRPYAPRAWYLFWTGPLRRGLETLRHLLQAWRRSSSPSPTTRAGSEKTTSTLILGRYLSRRRRINLRDYDETAHLTDLVADLAGDDRTTVTRRLWLQGGSPREADLVLIDSPPARGWHTRRALLEAGYVLIPAPPERMAVRAMRQMFATIREIQADRQESNPFLRILGVVPTLYTRQWREHRDFLQQMAEVCEEERVRLFPPVARRQSYLYLSMHGQDYRPISAEHAQTFLEPFGAVCNQFRPCCHRLSAHCYREVMRDCFRTWQEVVGMTPRP